MSYAIRTICRLFVMMTICLLSVSMGLCTEASISAQDDRTLKEELVLLMKKPLSERKLSDSQAASLI